MEDLEPEVIEEYVRCFTRTEMVRATCADYRPGATIDVEHDATDLRDQIKIRCPLLVASSVGRGGLTDVWRRWADDVTGVALDGGHFPAEESPVVLFDRLDAFRA